MKKRENYGIDAPGVARNLVVAAVILLGILVGARLFGSAPWLAPLLPTIRATGIICLAMSLWMVSSSLWFKHIVMRHLLDAHSWRGDEQVLDVGCGRGLVAVGAARRLGPGGRVHGLDLWQARDLSNNVPDNAMANAEAAGVADRLVIDTGDMRAMPYADGQFDVIVSMTAIHNIDDRDGRTRAIAEIWRVTKPGGQILIYDIRHTRAYAGQLKALGAADLRMSGPILLWGVFGRRFSAMKPA
ncbi:class I SAM-dependent methyltransferase [Sphingomonas oligophenolica]|uniref:Class I SAM-dependent methyltransferase n=1 Tax=Sphingomonas oligophenolica TaxID=301154 RepID=A0ABU9Y7F2_9SPHN